MENVSKALLIAGSIVLGLILLSTLLYMLRVGGSVNKAYDETQLSYQTQAFNYQFEIYQRDDNTIMDMVTLLNLAYSVNSDNNYDLNNSVAIVLNVGNKVFQIPKVLKNDSTTAEEFYNNNTDDPLSRNQVLYRPSSAVNGDNISIYDLVDKTIGELDISGTGLEGSDKLSKIHIGAYIYYPDLPANDSNAGKPVKGTNNGTTYKYIFNCDDNKLEYNKNTGRISKMVFECELNPNWELRVLPETPPEWD